MKFHPVALTVCMLVVSIQSIFARDPVAVGLATIPRRLSLLPHVIRSIQDQADIIYVYLNGHSEIPECLRHPKIIPILSDTTPFGDLGDTGKFYMAAHHDGYFLTIDDDLIYPPNYIDVMTQAVDKYEKRAIVGLHGSLVPNTIKTYRTGRDFVSNYFEELKSDTQVHVLGTGVAAFHTGYVKFSVFDFPVKNMADVWLALKAQKEEIPMICIDRPGRNWVKTTSEAHSPQSLCWKRPNDLLETELTKIAVPWRLPGRQAAAAK